MFARSRWGLEASTPARPTPFAAGGPEGQASNNKSAPDVSAGWLGEVVDMEADDAQHYFDASDLEPDEVDIHVHEVGLSESSEAASGRGNSADGFADGDCGQPQHSGQGVLEVIGAHVMGKRSMLPREQCQRRGPYFFFDKQIGYFVIELGDALGKLVGTTGAASVRR